jgi:hypothetical protein
VGLDGWMLSHGGRIRKLKGWNLGMGFCIIGVTLLNNTRSNVLMVIVY